MSSYIARSRAWLVRLWQIDSRLAATAYLMLGVLAACAVGLWLDPRLVLGAPVWLKPAKFALSIALYAVTLILLFERIPAFVRTRRVVGLGTALGLLLEMAIIGLQAARGTSSHFNVSTPLNATLFAVMGVAITLQTLVTVALAVALFRQRFADRALGWALRLGMLLTIVGASLGGLMTRPTPSQLSGMRSEAPLVIGAHSVGGADGGPGVPVLGWSREHGDVRAAHFLGLHALQVLPLLALALRRTSASRSQQARLVLALGASYAVLVGLMTWQALRGQPPFALDASALWALTGWLTSSALGAWRALRPPLSAPRVALSTP